MSTAPLKKTKETANDAFPEYTNASPPGLAGVGDRVRRVLVRAADPPDPYHKSSVFVLIFLGKVVMTLSCDTEDHLLRKRPHGLHIDMDRLAGFFRDRYPTATAAAVAADLGVSLRTVEAWLGSNPREPKATQIIKAIWIYGPDFLAVLLPEPPQWLSEAAREEERRKTLHAIEEMERRLSR